MAEFELTLRFRKVPAISSTRSQENQCPQIYLAWSGGVLCGSAPRSGEARSDDRTSPTRGAVGILGGPAQR